MTTGPSQPNIGGAWCLPWLLVVAIGMPALAHAQAPRWQVGTSPSLLRGTYGTGERTDIWYTPLVARRIFSEGDVTIVVPYTCIRGYGEVTVVGGAPVRIGASAPSTPVRGETGPTGRSVPAEATATLGTVCGPGDVVVRGRYYVMDQRGWKPTLAVRAHVKVPTASAARGLGTGRPDEGIGLEMSRTVRGAVILMVDGGYTRIGRPDDRRLRDTWWYDIGLSKSLVRDVVEVSVFFEEYRAIVAGLPSARDILAVVGVRGSTGWRLQIAGQFGVSDGAPDFGLTFGASRRF